MAGSCCVRGEREVGGHKLTMCPNEQLFSVTSGKGDNHPLLACFQACAFNEHVRENGEVLQLPSVFVMVEEDRNTGTITSALANYQSADRS